MTANSLAAATAEWIHAYGSTARHLIQAYRCGGERFVDAEEKRWEGLLQGTGSKWTDAAQHQVLAAQRLAGGYCARSLHLTTQGVDEFLQQVFRLAAGSVQQAETHLRRFEEQSGLPGLNQLATAVSPAAETASQIARQLESTTAALADQMAQGSRDDPPAKRITPFKKARSARLKAA